MSNLIYLWNISEIFLIFISESTTLVFTISEIFLKYFWNISENIWNISEIQRFQSYSLVSWTKNREFPHEIQKITGFWMVFTLKNGKTAKIFVGLLGSFLDFRFFSEKNQTFFSNISDFPKYFWNISEKFLKYFWNPKVSELLTGILDQEQRISSWNSENHWVLDGFHFEKWKNCKDFRGTAR